MEGIVSSRTSSEGIFTGIITGRTSSERIFTRRTGNEGIVTIRGSEGIRQ
jgi:hypothetical protein